MATSTQNVFNWRALVLFIAVLHASLVASASVPGGTPYYPGGPGSTGPSVHTNIRRPPSLHPPSGGYAAHAQAILSPGFAAAQTARLRQTSAFHPPSPFVGSFGHNAAHVNALEGFSRQTAIRRPPIPHPFNPSLAGTRYGVNHGPAFPSPMFHQPGFSGFPSGHGAMGGVSEFHPYSLDTRTLPPGYSGPVASRGGDPRKNGGGVGGCGGGVGGY